MPVPDPLTPRACDLRDFEFMPLHVGRLRDSGTAASTTAEEFRAALMLWAAAWHQVPAGSVPDDDANLSKLAGYGFAVAQWRKVKRGALSNFIKCSDGRLYHRVVCEIALNSWESKLKHAHEKMCDRLRKENRARLEKKAEQLPIPTFDEWKSATFPAETITNSIGNDISKQDTSGGIPAEIALKGREGKRSEGIENRDVEVYPPPVVSTLAAVAENGNIATGKNQHSRAKINGAGQQWDRPAYVAATAATVGIQRRQGESDEDFKDRVYSAVQQRMNEGKRA